MFVRGRIFTAALVATAFAAVFAACAPRAALSRAGPGASGNPPRVVHIANVPFFPDNTDQCGPASLASLLAYWKKPASPAELKADVYVPRLQGTLPMDMAPALTSRGLSAEVISGTFDDVKNELRENRPVLAYLDFGTRSHPIGHFVVITGFDDDRRGLIIHSGREHDKFASYTRFNRGWKDTDHWMMVVRSTEEAISLATAISTGAVEPGSKISLLHQPPRFHAALTREEFFQLGQTYEKQGLKKEAETEYQSALRLDKNFVPALMALGNLAFEAKDYRAAEKRYERVLKMDPSHGGANNNLAMIYVAESKHLDRAETLAKKAAESPIYRPYADDTLVQIHLKRIAND